METPDAPQLSDGDLVREALRGSDEAFGELVRRYQDLLYRLAERMTGRADDAEDVVQAAFIKAYRRLGSCRDPDRVGAWLFRIGSNACKDFLKTRRRAVPLDEVASWPSEEETPGRTLERGWMKAEIDRALARLPADQREAFLLKHVEGWSYVEMSEQLGISIPALKMRVHRAREELQTLLAVYRRE